jgi:hypothetical protein
MGAPLVGSELDALYALTSGHPYLTRRLLHLVIEGHSSSQTLFGTAADDSGPFGDHLRYHLLRLVSQPELAAAFAAVISGNSAPSSEAVYDLESLGRVRIDKSGRPSPRCGLYAN